MSITFTLLNASGSLNPTGPYDAGTTYAVNDLVTSGGSLYRSLVGSNTGHTPASSPTQWELEVSKGDAGAAGAAGATGATGATGPAGADGADGAQLDAANVFTALQTLSVADGSGNNPTVCAVVRHTASGGVGSWCGAAARFEASDGVTPESIGAVRARKHSGTDGTLMELAPAYAGTLCPTGLRARATAASCINGVELIMGPSGTDPILQPCQETPPTDLGLTIQPIGTGVLRLKRPVVPSGTVADISGGTAPFNSPVAGQLAWATDATGGPTLAIYTGSAWVMATVSALA